MFLRVMFLVYSKLMKQPRMKTSEGVNCTIGMTQLYVRGIHKMWLFDSHISTPIEVLNSLIVFEIKVIYETNE